MNLNENNSIKFEVRNKLSKTEKNKNKRTISKNMESTKFDFWYQMMWITPALIFLFFFSYYAIYVVFRNGFNASPRTMFNFKMSIINFKNIFHDNVFLVALRNSVIYAFFEIPISLGLSILTAKLISNVLNKKMFSFLQSLFFLPYVTSSLAVAMTFSFLFSPYSYGLMNEIFSLFGISAVDWGSPKNGMVLVVIYGVWKALPFEIIMFTSAFVRIDKTYYFSAAVDGVPKWKQFWKVSIPQIMPMIIYMITTGFIGAFKIFPLGLFSSYASAVKAHAQTVVFYIYEKVNASSTSPSYGKGGAASLVLLFVILFLTIMNRILSKLLKRKYG